MLNRYSIAGFILCGAILSCISISTRVEFTVHKLFGVMFTNPKPTLEEARFISIVQEAAIELWPHLKTRLPLVTVFPGDNASKLMGQADLLQNRIYIFTRKNWKDTVLHEYGQHYGPEHLGHDEYGYKQQGKLIDLVKRLQERECNIEQGKELCHV